VKNAKVFIYDTQETDPVGNPIYFGKGTGFVCFESQHVAAQVQSKYPHELVFMNHPL